MVFMISSHLLPDEVILFVVNYCDRFRVPHVTRDTWGYPRQRNWDLFKLRMYSSEKKLSVVQMSHNSHNLPLLDDIGEVCVENLLTLGMLGVTWTRNTIGVLVTRNIQKFCSLYFWSKNWKRKCFGKRHMEINGYNVNKRNIIPHFELFIKSLPMCCSHKDTKLLSCLCLSTRH